jgi:hypothetical protein
VATLLGAMLVVTGPTVIGPLLSMIRPNRRVAAVAKWEGITIDPIGVLLALVVFEAILGHPLSETTGMLVMVVLKMVVAGSLIGVVAAVILVILLRRHGIPDNLQETVTLMLVAAAYLAAELFQEESGLFAVTLMGMVLANQRYVDVTHIVSFKETLRTLIISSLFIILAARLPLESVRQLDWRVGVFLALLILVVRPLAVWLSAWGSPLQTNEKIFLSWMAPRGIVAAAVSSVFALRLMEMEEGMAQAELLVPVTFAVIVTTVALYGLTAQRLALRLGLASLHPQGLLMMGAHEGAQQIATTVQQEGFRVLLVDTNRANAYRARMADLDVYSGSVLEEHLTDEIDLSGLGRFVGLTPNDEANSLAALHFEHLFGRKNVYQLAPWRSTKQGDGDGDEYSPRHLRGRFLFGERVNYSLLNDGFRRGAVVKATGLTEDFNYEAFCRHYDDDVILLFVIEDEKTLLLNTQKDPLTPRPGQTVIALVHQTETDTVASSDVSVDQE